MDDQIIKIINSLSLTSGLCRKNAQKELDTWFYESMKLIRDTYNEKTREIDRLFETLQKNLEVYKERQSMTIAKQNRHLLMEDVDQLRNSLTNLIQVKNTPGSIYDLQICNKCESLETPTVSSTLQYSLQRTIPVRTYRFSSTCRAMACSQKTDEILLYENDELILYNVDGTLGGSVSWSTTEDGFVSDIVWCSILDCFLVLSRLTLSLFNARLYTTTRIKQVRGTQTQQLIAFTYIEQSKTVLVCCNDSKEIIRQYGPLPDWNLLKTWSRDTLIQKDDAGIRCIRISPSSNFLGLVIKNKNDLFRVSIYSIDLNALITSIPITVSFSPSKGPRCSDFMLYLTPFLNDRWWIIIYGNGIHEHSLMLIDRNTGKSEVILIDAVLNACMLDEQYLIVRMKQSMLLYDIQ